MILYFRLFAGFTSFMSNLCFDHFFSMGPDGNLGVEGHGSSHCDDAEEDGERDGGEAEGQQHRHAPMANFWMPADTPAVREPERLEHRPEPVPEVEPEADHGDDVDAGAHDARRGCASDVRVDLAVLEPGVDDARP